MCRIRYLYKYTYLHIHRGTGWERVYRQNVTTDSKTYLEFYDHCWRKPNGIFEYIYTYIHIAPYSARGRERQQSAKRCYSNINLLLHPHSLLLSYMLVSFGYFLTWPLFSFIADLIWPLIIIPHTNTHRYTRKKKVLPWSSTATI